MYVFCPHVIGGVVPEHKHEWSTPLTLRVVAASPLQFCAAVTIETVITLVINAPGNESVARDDVGTL